MKRLLALLSLLLLPASAWTEPSSTPPAKTASPAEVNRATAFASQQHLADDPEWLALLHMTRDALLRYRSSIDDNDFFLHPRGRFDPNAELAATVTAFVQQQVIDGEAAACRYPARYDFLARHMELPPAPVCERFESWREKLAPKSVSLVFSSYYMNNPASIYGHTFLKLARQGYESTGPLLDYTVNYAATTNTKNGVLFAAKGLLGGYRGRFSTDPYYMKIQKYNNMESRDLWEYELNLTPDQIDRLVKHLWELGGTSMRYFFFNKNCSYQLLPLLDVANPQLQLARQFRYRAIPLDTLKVVAATPGLVTARHLRPSHTRVMLARRSLLNGMEVDVAEALVVDPSSAPVEMVEGLKPERKALVLDSAYDLLRYRSGFYRDQPAAVQATERRILDLRRTIPATVKLPDPPLGDVAPPESGHNTGRIGFFTGADKHRPFQEVNVRAAIHDLEMDPTGYIEGSQLEMFNIRGRYQDRDRPEFYLEEAKLFEIISVAPRDRWVHPPSWTVRARVYNAHDLGKDPNSSLVSSLDGGSGFAWQAGDTNQRLISYAMWKADFEAGSALSKGQRGGMGAEAGVLARLGQLARLHLHATVLRFFTGDVGNLVEIAATPSISLAENVELRANLARSNGHAEADAGLNLYW